MKPSNPIYLLHNHQRCTIHNSNNNISSHYEKNEQFAQHRKVYTEDGAVERRHNTPPPSSLQKPPRQKHSHRYIASNYTIIK